MIKIILNGCSGKMGHMITETSAQFDNLEIIGGIDKFKSNLPYPIFENQKDVNIEYDVLLDFSNANSLNDIIELTERTKKPLIICSTGYTKDQLSFINEKSKSLPLFKSANMSVGINQIGRASCRERV